MRERLELNVWNIGKSIAIHDRETTQIISIRFPLPPMILKIPENWNYELKDKIIDFSFYIEIIRTSSVIEDCSNNLNGPLSCMCIATPLVRFNNGSTLISYEAINQIFTKSNTSNIERISRKLSGTAKDCRLLMRSLRELYLLTLSRRLNDVSDNSWSEASHNVNLFLGICFEACKLNQVWVNFLQSDNIAWDEKHSSRNTNYGPVNSQRCIPEFSRVIRNWPSEYANLQRFVRSNYIFLTDWNCCSR